MGCCEGSCSCGKGNQSPEQENIHLVQMSAKQGMLVMHDWMKGLGSLTLDEEVVEIRFKNNRKDFFRNRNGISLKKDDRVVVEVETGHDLGTVSLTGILADKQFKQKSTRGTEASIEINKGSEALDGERKTDKSGLKKVNRKATQGDLDKWLGAKKRERNILLQSRGLAENLGLKMNISDVEFQGDGGKVTIYYEADGRVDMRELVRKYSNAFQVKIEMRNIS